MTTNKLSITQLTSNQNNKEVTINDANNELQDVLAASVSVTITSTNAGSVAQTTLNRAGIINVLADAGDLPTAAITVTLDAFERGSFTVVNQTAQEVTVTIAGQPITAPAVPAGETFTLIMDGMNVRSAGGGGGGGGGGGTTINNTFNGPTIQSPFAGVLVSKSANQTNVGAVAFPGVALTWDQETYDTDAFHDNVTNNSRLTIPSGQGIRRVRLSANVQFNAATTGGLYIAVRKNGTDVPGMGALLLTGGASRRRLNVVSAPLEVVDGDYFELFAWADTTTNDDVETDETTWFALDVVEREAGATQVVVATPGFFQGARVRLNANQTLSASVDTPLSFTVEDFDTDSFHDNAVNPTRITIPANLGIRKVRLEAAMDTSTPSSGALSLSIRKNGEAFPGQGVSVIPAAGSGSEGIHVSTGVVEVVDGDYFEAVVFSNNAGSADANTGTWFSIEVIEGAANARPGAAQNWAVPNRGARCSFAVDTTLDLSSATNLAWTTEDFDTDNFFDAGTPGVFTVPDGITKVRLITFLDPVAADNLVDGANVFVTFRKNGSAEFKGNMALGGNIGFSNQIGGIVSGTIDVVSGDTLQARALIDGDTAVQLQGNTSYFEVQVVEASDSALRPFDLETFVNGPPADGATVLQTVLARTAQLPAGGGNSQGYASTAATSASSFSITRNGVSVGTVNFGVGANVATFTIASDVAFVAGDRIALVAPSPQDASLSDVSITLALGLST